MDQIINVRIKQKHNKMSEWAKVDNTFVPLDGEIIIYDDRYTKVNGGIVTKLPGFKVGDGVHTLHELSFFSEDEIRKVEEELLAHMNDKDAHVNDGEREFWNSKFTCSVQNDVLNFNNK